MLVVNLVDSADVGVIQCRGGLRFALETAQCLGILRYLVGKELQGNETVELDVLGLVDHSHAAAAEFLQDAVMRDGLSDELGTSGHWREC